ncbi:prefoldin subunit 2-like [Saccoglossus kowalevskii]|uniref:Prefoldin subunit 2-like n=1 Tax=Saccoglossus kowalevskii TaxID=10224 RepID=A0ABM0H1V4_SACKO|nr:PREDICTED: prefoldin subunit 2-like [Saccoglossus kowalevskii]
MASEVSKKSSGKLSKSVTQEQVISGFNQLRQEQRSLATKIAELEVEQNEHRLVVETLKEVDGSRRCFRMVGGILVERTVDDVLPALDKNRQQIKKLVESLNEQIELKGKQINEYREKYNIRVQGEQGTEDGQLDKKEKPGTQGVLVAKDS